MLDFAKGVDVVFQIRLETSEQADVTGKVVGDITLRLMNADSADWELQTATTHFTLTEMSLGAYKLTLLAARNDTFGGLYFQVECAGCEDKRYGFSISDKQGLPVVLNGGLPTLSGMLTKMADNTNDGSVFAEGDSLAEVVTAIVAGVPTSDHADVEPGGGNITTGTNIAGDGDNTWLNDGSPWTIAPTALVGGFGLNVDQTFTLPGKSANIIRITAKEDIAGVVHVWLWNYMTVAWEQVSETSSAISGNSYTPHSYTVYAQNQEDGTGEVKVRYTSTNTNGAKRLYLGLVQVDSVVAGPTLEEYAQAVAEHNVSEHTDHNSFGFRASLSLIDEYGITAVADASHVTCASLPAVTNMYQGHRVLIHDVTNNDQFYGSWILSMDNAGAVILGRPSPVALDTAAELYVMQAMVTPAQISAEIDAATHAEMTAEHAVLSGEHLDIEDDISDVADQNDALAVTLGTQPTTVQMNARTLVANLYAQASELSKVLGAVAGKKVINAEGTQVLIYNESNVLMSTLNRSGDDPGPYTWTPSWE